MTETIETKNDTEDHTKIQSWQVLSLDSWRSADGGWDLNQWWEAGKIEASIDDLYKPRRLLRLMREAGMLGTTSKGTVAVEVLEGDPTTIRVLAKGTREPLFSIDIEWN